MSQCHDLEMIGMLAEHEKERKMAKWDASDRSVRPNASYDLTDRGM